MSAQRREGPRQEPRKQRVLLPWYSLTEQLSHEDIRRLAAAREVGRHARATVPAAVAGRQAVMEVGLGLPARDGRGRPRVVREVQIENARGAEAARERLGTSKLGVEGGVCGVGGR